YGSTVSGWRSSSSCSSGTRGRSTKALRRAGVELLPVAHRQELDQLAVGVADEDPESDVGVGEDLTPVAGDASAHALDVVDAEGDMGEARLVHHALARGLGPAREVQQLEDEPVAAEVEGGHAQWLRQT